MPKLGSNGNKVHSSGNKVHECESLAPMETMLTLGPKLGGENRRKKKKEPLTDRYTYIPG